MEIKFLVYLVAGIIWFIFNNKNKVKKESTTKVDLVRSVLVETVSTQAQKNDKQSSTYRIPANRTKNVAQVDLNGNLKLQPTKPTKEITKREILFASKTEKSDATAAFAIIEIDTNVDYEQYSIGNKIGIDIRNGNLDLRQAVVINELLRPVYF